MKEYRIDKRRKATSIFDKSNYYNPKYIKGFANVRKEYPVSWFYSRNIKAWHAYDDTFEYIAIEC